MLKFGALQSVVICDFIVTGSHDRSVRRWDRTEEPFFIEDVYFTADFTLY